MHGVRVVYMYEEESAKYRNIVSTVSPIHCLLSFYTTIAFKSYMYIPLSFSERMFFVNTLLLKHLIVVLTRR